MYVCMYAMKIIKISPQEHGKGLLCQTIHKNAALMCLKLRLERGSTWWATGTYGLLGCMWASPGWCWFWKRKGAAEVCYLQRPGEAVGEYGVSVEAEDLGVKESWREIETWHPVGMLESTEKAQEWWLLKMPLNSSTDPSILEIPGDKCQGQ